MLPKDSRRDTCCDVDGMCSAGPVVCVCAECHVSRYEDQICVHVGMVLYPLRTTHD